MADFTKDLTILSNTWKFKGAFMYQPLIRRKLILFAVILSFLSACSSSGIKGLVEPPTVQVHKLEMGSLNLSGGSATIILDIENPNSFPIPLAGFDDGLSLNGVKVAQGDKAHKVTIRSGEAQKVSVPITLSFTNMVNMIPGLLRSKEMDYSLDGSVHLPWFNIPFQRAGKTALK